MSKQKDDDEDVSVCEVNVQCQRCIGKIKKRKINKNSKYGSENQKPAGKL